MRELGAESERAHEDIGEFALEAGIDRLILIGPEYGGLVSAFHDKVAIDRAADVDQAIAVLKGRLASGDAVLVKASNSVGLARLVEVMAVGRELVNEGPDH